MTRFIQELTSPVTKPLNAFLLKNRSTGSTESPTHVAVIDGKAVPFDLWIDGTTEKDLQSQLGRLKKNFTIISTPNSAAIQSINLNPALDTALPPRAFRHSVKVLAV